MTPKFIVGQTVRYKIPAPPARYVDGQQCTIGVFCKARGIDLGPINPDDPRQVGGAVGIARSMAAEIEFENDDDFAYHRDESSQERWNRMYHWVKRQII